MPTLIVLDVSVSMGIVAEPSSGNAHSKLELVVQGLNTFLDYISSRQKLEFISLLTFSHKCEIVCPFTRDLNSVKEKLSQLNVSNTTSSLKPVIKTIEELFMSEWDLGTDCNILLITQDGIIFPSNYQLHLPFPTNIMLVTVNNGFVSDGISHLASTTPHKCKIYHPDVPFIPRSFHMMFYKLCEEHFAPWIGLLTCGNLSTKIVLSPNPVPHTKVSDFDHTTYTMDQVIEICGFVEMQHVGSPGSISRHLVLPYSCSMTSLPSPVDTPKMDPARASQIFGTLGVSQTAHTNFMGLDIKPNIENIDEDSSGEGYLPSFCVLLHGALKVESMAALCYIGRDWYGLLYSWADSKKKSNLMLSLLDPGPDAVPWLGNLNNLIIPSSSEETTLCEKFPIKPLAKRVFLPNPSSWIRQSGLQADIQRVLRHARKLPEKTQQFFKELNRVRKAALSIGFVQLLEGLAAILERECTLLPGTAHPGCALQLSHASSLLKEPHSLDIRYNMIPMKMSF